MGAITFGKPPLSKGSGATPSIAINDQLIVVTVHLESGSIVYRVGSANKKSRTLRLNESRPLISGERPTVALNRNQVVCSYGRGDSIFSRAGTDIDAEAGTIQWGPETKIDSGKTPSVALDQDGTALDVHRSESGIGVYCEVGPYDAAKKTINWPGSGSKYDTGELPRVALNGTVACEVHRSETARYDLYYNVGSVNPKNRSCSLGGGNQYYDTRSGGADNGATPAPSVALTNNLIAIEVHDLGNGDSPLAYFFGTVDAKDQKIGWPKSPTPIDVFGSAPSVAVNNGGVVTVAYTAGGVLTYLVGTF